MMHRLVLLISLLAGVQLVAGCAVVPLVAPLAAAVGTDLAIDPLTPSLTTYIEPTTEPSAVSGPLSCEEQDVAGGERLVCVGGVPGHAKWCNDLIVMVSNTSGGFIRGLTGTSQDHRIIERYCIGGEVPPEIAALQ